MEFESEALLPTPGSFVLALQLEGGMPPARGAAGDFTQLILAASPIVKAVMGLLLLFSVISWGIVLYKWWTFRGIENHSSTFLDMFRNSAKFSEVQAVCPSLAASPLVGMFQAGYAELNCPASAVRTRPGQSRNPCATSNPQEPYGGGPRVAARLVDGSEQVGEARAVPRDDGEHHALHRVVRNGVGDHDGVHEHRRSRARPISRSSHAASPKRSSRRRSACSRRFRPSTSTTTSRPR